MPVLTQPPSMGDALKYELNPNYTRETVTLAEGLQYPAGAVLGRVTVSGQYTFASHGGSDGAETAAGILLYPVDTRLSEATGTVQDRARTHHGADLPAGAAGQAAQAAGSGARGRTGSGCGAEADSGEVGRGVNNSLTRRFLRPNQELESSTLTHSLVDNIHDARPRPIRIGKN